MNRTRTLSLAGVVVGAVVVTGVGVSGVMAAGPTTELTIRQADFVPSLSDTRTAGHWDFWAEGLHIWTDNSTGQAKSAEYFPIMKPLSEVTSWNYEWYGSTPQITQQFFIDTDGNTATREGILVAEKNYPAGDVWLTNSSSDALKLAAPSCDGDPIILTAPNDQHCLGGGGSYFHGTLAEWAAAVPSAVLTYGGFAMGSGVQGDGVLHSLTYGDTRYVFAGDPPSVPTETVTATATATVTVTATPEVADVTGAAVLKRKAREVTIRMRSDEQPGDAAMGEPLVWSVEVDGEEVAHYEQGFGETDTWSMTFDQNTGRHRVALFKNGDRVRSIRINTGG